MQHACSHVLKCVQQPDRARVANLTEDGNFAGEHAARLDGLAVGGVIALSKSAAAEYAPMGIRVNVVNPGMVATPAVLAAGDLVPEFHQRGIDAHALGRMGEPGEVAATIAFLLSDGAAFITGECIAVDGGVQVKATTYP